MQQYLTALSDYVAPVEHGIASSVSQHRQNIWPMMQMGKISRS